MPRRYLFYMLYLNRADGSLSFQTDYSTIRGRAISAYQWNNRFVWLVARFDPAVTLPKVLEDGPMELSGQGTDGWAVYADPDRISYGKEPDDTNPLIFGDHGNGTFAANTFLQWILQKAGGMPDPEFIGFARGHLHSVLVGGSSPYEGVSVKVNHLNRGPKGFLITSVDARGIYSRIFKKYCSTKQSRQ